jgi:hypothetical protein
MRIVPVLSCCLFFFFHSFGAETRHIHLLKILDSENSDYIIREACQNISVDIDKEIKLMQHFLDVYTVHEHEVVGSHFNREELLRKVDYEMSYLEGDIVIVVYVGHGYRSKAKDSAAPMLYLNTYEESIDFLDIQQIILDKRPSVLMSLVLACNKTQTDFNRPPDIIAYNEPIRNVTLKAPAPYGLKEMKYKALFKETPQRTRCIDLFGADKEYLTFISQNGGIFYNEVFQVLHTAFSNDEYISWEDICSDIEASTMAKLQQRGLDSQKPLCRYYLSIHPVEVGHRSFPSLDKQQWKERRKELKKLQKEQLRTLRRQHRQEMRTARRSDIDRDKRRVIALQQKAALKDLKAQHKIDQIRLEKRYELMEGSQ